MKKIIYLVFYLVFFFLFTRCELYLPIPKDTNLELWITEEATNKKMRDFELIPGSFGSKMYYGTGYHGIYQEEMGIPEDPDKYVKYIVTNYPDYTSPHPAITRIEITDEKVMFYGLSLTSTTKEITTTMKKLGYHLEQDEKNLIAEKGNITFTFQSNRIVIDASVTNLFGIVF